MDKGEGRGTNEKGRGGRRGGGGQRRGGGGQGRKRTKHHEGLILTAIRASGGYAEFEDPKDWSVLAKTRDSTAPQHP